jgi:hypothetical protein
MLKSHESFKPTYKRVIYVVRDPRAVCTSYYYYLANIQRTIDLETTSSRQFSDLFVSGLVDTYGSWGEHVRSWLAAETADFLLIQYENLLSDPIPILSQICGFLQLSPPEGGISAAVRDCSISNLRAKESNERSTWRQTRKATNAFFFREGGASKWDALDGSLLDSMYTKWGKEMKELNYL